MLSMSKEVHVPLMCLGQVGWMMRFPGCTLFVDPYWSCSAQSLDRHDPVPLRPTSMRPDDVTDSDWVLITHPYLDQCDPNSPPDLAKASVRSRFMGPPTVLALLERLGVERQRLQPTSETVWSALAPGLRVIALPAARPTIQRDAQGRSIFVGYLLDFCGKRILHAGDTALEQAVLDAVVVHGPVHTAFLPVNERNFFRDRRGLGGNMSVREAFGLAEEIGAKQVIPLRWSISCANETSPEEMRSIYRRMRPDFSLLIEPQLINLAEARISVIIRTLNEARRLDELLRSIGQQETNGLGHEVIVVDSGSTDGTLDIAERFGCRVVHIAREDFSFGRSLNLGCESATGDLIVITSGHCVPVDRHWLQRLVQPLIDGEASYSFGRQLGGDDSHFSEKRIFAKYFPEHCGNGQKEYFCNNANAALTYTAWAQLRFDEELTGLEDMELAQRLVRDGGRVEYVPEAKVYHYHQESWSQIQRRFEREALALRHIMPNIHVGPVDLFRYILTSVVKDWSIAWREGIWFKHALDIFRYRVHQYRGVYKGNNEHRKLSHSEKEKYFYPE